MKNLKRKIVVLLLMALTISFVGELRESSVVYGATKEYCNCISNVKIKDSEDEVTVSYKVNLISDKINCYIGIEDYTGTIRQEKRVGVNGKHKITWKMSSPVYRIYAVIKARGYTDKDIIKTIYHVKTGTKYHTVTKKEEMTNKIGVTVVSSAISIAGFFVPESKVMEIGLTVAGISFGTLATFSYNPTEGDYQVTKTTFDKKKKQLKVSLKIYKSKASYKNGDKPIAKTSGTKYLGFNY